MQGRTGIAPCWGVFVPLSTGSATHHALRSWAQVLGQIYTLWGNSPLAGLRGVVRALLVSFAFFSANPRGKGLALALGCLDARPLAHGIEHLLGIGACR